MAVTEDDGECEAFAEMDPSGRYGRYNELLGAGAVKEVYRAFDLEQGIEVAWNMVNLSSFAGAPTMLARLFAEVDLLKSLHHPHILSMHKQWKSSDGGTFNFITEICPSGDLSGYRKLHKNVSPKAIRKWAHQILLGLNYLHAREPCVIHRDLKCSNIFVKGNIGQVVIGDLGLAAVVDQSHKAHSFLGTPEYMAPELYEQDYNELVDIYSFGLCVLELFTGEKPYKECTSIPQIMGKVINGLQPEALSRMQEQNVKMFIERCLGKPGNRPSATELLCDPFFHEFNGFLCLVLQPVSVGREDEDDKLGANQVLGELNE